MANICLIGDGSMENMHMIIDGVGVSIDMGARTIWQISLWSLMEKEGSMDMLGRIPKGLDKCGRPEVTGRKMKKAKSGASHTDKTMPTTGAELDCGFEGGELKEQHKMRQEQSACTSLRTARCCTHYTPGYIQQ